MSKRKSVWEHFPRLREEAPHSDVIAVYGATCETTKDHTICSGDLFITHTHVAFAGGDKEREEKYLIPFSDIRSHRDTHFSLPLSRLTSSFFFLAGVSRRPTRCGC
jgi:hypothetical protein